MKKIIALIVAVLMAAVMFAGCTTTQQPSATPAASTAAPSVSASTAPSASASASASQAATGFEIAMITDKGNIDDHSFNQGTWEGILKYCADNKDITHKYYKPTDVTTDAYVGSIDLAIKGGAKIVVTPGYMFEPAIYVEQDKYPDIKFVLIDGNPNDGDYSKAGGPTYKIDNNVYSVFFAEQQAGFLAGYAAVKDGYTKLGFMGGQAVPAVVRYGYGYVQGAEAAAKELGLAKGSIDMKYFYTGDFAATPEHQATAASWYKSGTQVIFGCGGSVGNSVFAAAEANKGKSIGVDVDQSTQSASVVTSAMKKVGTAAYSALTDYYGGKFQGGKSVTLDIQNDMVALPFSTSKFAKFTQADYDAIVAALKSDKDGIRTGLWNDKTAETPDKLQTTYVKMNFIKQ